MARGRRSNNEEKNGATLGFEATLWAAADKLRNNLDASEYKHVVLGLIFLKYISDAFEEKHTRLLKEVAQGADPEDPDEYRADNIFWVPKESRWSFLQANAKQATIGKLVDDAMVAIERDNRSLKGVLPKDYARPALDKQRLGELIDLVAKGLVAEIRELINVKDAFTRMNLEREEEKRLRLVEQQAKIEKLQRQRTKLASVKKDLSALFAESNNQRRGKALEGILNNLFEASGILIREAFTLNGSQGEGIIEQIDGVVEIDGSLYLVEMKWWREPLGVGEVSNHLVRIYRRGQIRGIIISESGYTEPSISTCKDALRDFVIVLCKLEEIVMLLEHEKDLKAFFKAKINAAMIDRNPMAEVNLMELAS